MVEEEEEGVRVGEGEGVRVGEREGEGEWIQRERQMML